jgi:hypothetical protein
MKCSIILGINRSTTFYRNGCYVVDVLCMGHSICQGLGPRLVLLLGLGLNLGLILSIGLRAGLSLGKELRMDKYSRMRGYSRSWIHNSQGTPRCISALWTDFHTHVDKSSQASKSSAYWFRSQHEGE